MTFENSDIEDITFYTNPDGDIFPENELPENSRLLKGFIWRGDERILSKEAIFDEDDNNIELVKISGVENPIDKDVDAETSLLEKKARDFISSSAPAGGITPQKSVPNSKLAATRQRKYQRQKNKNREAVRRAHTGLLSDRECL